MADMDLVILHALVGMDSVTHLGFVDKDLVKVLGSVGRCLPQHHDSAGMDWATYRECVVDGGLEIYLEHEQALAKQL